MAPRALTLLALIALLCRPARAAAEEEEWVLSVTPIYAYFVLEGKGEPEGGGILLAALYGVSDAISLRLSGLWSGHDIEPAEKSEGGLYQIVNIAFGGQYAFDLLRVRAALELGIGALYARYHDASTTNLGLQIGISADYWILRWLGVGAAFHYHAFISNPTQYPVYFDAGPRVALRWQ